MERVLSKEFSDEELLNLLREFYEENGRRPYMKDFRGKIPSDNIIANRFGKWSIAIELAGIPKGKLRESDYDDEYLLNCLLELYNTYGKVPTNRDLKKYGLPSNYTYIKHFGSFKNGLIKTGLYELREDKHQFCETYTDEEMMENLKSYMKNKVRIPVHSIIKEELRNPSISAYERRFYSIFNALKLIGYDYEKQKEEDLIELENDMISKYKKLREILNKVPSSRDIENYSRNHNFGYSMSSYEFHFGSLYELQVLCEFNPTVIGRNKSRQDLIDDLIMMSEELERTPSQNDLKYFDSVASNCTYRNKFGSWNEAVKESGLKPNSNIYYSNNGIECLSYYELLFTNMLEEYHITFTKEDMYKKFIPTNKNYRFDFILNLDNHQYFVEIFGITCRDDYKIKTEIKINLCKEYNIPLIEVYPDDYTSYKLEELHKMLMNKISKINLHN